MEFKNWIINCVSCKEFEFNREMLNSYLKMARTSTYFYESLRLVNGIFKVSFIWTNTDNAEFLFAIKNYWITKYKGLLILKLIYL